MHEPNKFSKETETIKNKGIRAEKYNGRIQCRVKKKGKKSRQHSEESVTWKVRNLKLYSQRRKKKVKKAYGTYGTQ